jgi:hypothetical protein
VSFTTEWLALREPADTAARSEKVTRLVADALLGRDVIRVLDLGAGTGANARYLGSRLPARQEWLLLDHDARLLTLAAAHGDTREVDLGELRRGAWWSEAIAGRDLVTASALLDLVSDEWLSALLDRCAERHPALLFALNYDGRIGCTPQDPDDSFVAALVNMHQHRDKGFGPALGPRAAAETPRLLMSLGYMVRCGRSDWQLGPGEAPLQRELVQGWAAAATEVVPPSASRIAAWLDRRQAAIAAGTSHIVVGHQDVAAIPGSPVRRARRIPS